MIIKQIEQRKMAQIFEKIRIVFLYGTIAGRIILGLLVHPSVSRHVGKFLDSRFSGWIVPWYIKKHHIDMKEYEDRSYTSFNDFFTRKRCAENKSGELAEQFAGGTCLIFRLTPQDYHRYCYVCDGIMTESRVIGGCLHCVRPTAYTSVPVFVENSREYTMFSTRHFGTIVQMEVGALLVGKIHNIQNNGQVFQGQEKGYFEFGGSTILILVRKECLELSEAVLEHTKNGKEMRIFLGQKVGTKKAFHKEIT